MIELTQPFCAPLDTCYDWQPGDRVSRLDGTPVEDILDFYFCAPEQDTLALQITRADGTLLDIEVPAETLDTVTGAFAPLEFRRCACNCVFCFIDQNPADMRETIYVKDEDYRFSFLYGNYVTLTSLGRRGRERIIEQNLSPLFVSVHATDIDVRTKMLGIKKRMDIVELLRQFSDAGITMHTQVVLCPGLNDGDVLDKTIRDLLELAPGVSSLAIVPVGLTSHREGLPQLIRVGPDKAREVIEQAAPWQELARERIGENFVYLSDEFYLLAGLEFPPSDAYDGFPQIDNGIGLSVDLCETWSLDLEESRAAGTLPKTPATILTGQLACRVFERGFLPAVRSCGAPPIDLVPVENGFFGPGVTVAGLLSGESLREALLRLPASPTRTILLPPRVFNSDDITLDDMTLEEIVADSPHECLVAPEEGFIDFWRAIG